jgi:hypothetical protein
VGRRQLPQIEVGRAQVLAASLVALQVLAGFGAVGSGVQWLCLGLAVALAAVPDSIKKKDLC